LFPGVPIVIWLFLMLLVGVSGSGPVEFMAIALLVALVLSAAGTSVAVLVDRRRFVQMRLLMDHGPGREPQLELTRSGGAVVTYPLAAVDAVIVNQQYSGTSGALGLPAAGKVYGTPLLLIAGHAERGRRGPAELTQRWVDAFAAAGRAVEVRKLYVIDDHLNVRRIRPGRPGVPRRRVLPYRARRWLWLARMLANRAGGLRRNRPMS
jgi:hypothetical protein